MEVDPSIGSSFIRTCVRIIGYCADNPGTAFAWAAGIFILITVVLFLKKSGK